MSIEITKSAEETYRRVLHSLNVKYKGQEILVVIDDDDNGGSVNFYDMERNELSDSAVVEVLQEFFSEYREPSELTENKKWFFDKEDGYWWEDVD
jgi:hypothetical protein|tara:strand:+ start:1291 stop:1575 length:285 start_codon:yes stop_codon:yes gene_type:complete